MSPSYHGPTHSPDGTDPIKSGVFHKFGDAGEPTFAGTWAGKLWFKLVVGFPVWKRSSLEIVMAVDGGTAGTTIGTLPAGYYEWALGENVPGNGQDAAGGFRAYYIDGTNGNIVDGPMP